MPFEPVFVIDPMVGVPVITTLVEPSATAILAEASAFSILVTEVVVVSLRTSIVSPAAGASVNVNVVELTAYAVVGNCTTPFIDTMHDAVVCASDSVNATVELSPEKFCVAITVNEVVPTAFQPSVALYCSNVFVVVLNLNIPTTPVDGLCPVVPMDNIVAPVSTTLNGTSVV